MNKVWAVIRREFIERVRTKAFLLSTFLFPVFLGAMMVLPALLLTKSSGTKRVAVLDGTSVGFGGRVVEALEAVKRGDGADAESQYEPVLVTAVGEALEAAQDSLISLTGLGNKAASSSLNGVLVLTDAGLASGRMQYFGDNAGSPSAMSELQGTIRPLVTRERLEREGVDPLVVMRAIGPVSLATQRVADGQLTGQSGDATFAIAYAMGLILYIALLLYGVQVMTSIVEEKTNRIMEVLASSMTPFQMMLGKIVGVGSVALLQLSIWAGAAYGVTQYQSQLLSFFGAEPSSGGMTGMIPSIPGTLLIVFLVFFILGFLLYSSLFAAVGSMCNTVQETQQAQFPVMFLVILGLFTVFALLNDPSSPLANTLSYVPFWTPFVIPVRYSMAPIPILELLLSALVTIAGMLAIVWVASRIYRVGILSYGKRASLKDLWRWVRTA